MTNILYTFVTIVSNIHSDLLAWNDSITNSFTDKQLHFLVIGLFGIAMIVVLHPLFVWLAHREHTIVISFLYVFTVIIVLTFAIEVGQGYYGTGAMESGDVLYGIAGFLIFFVIYLIIRGIVHLIMRWVGKEEEYY